MRKLMLGMLLAAGAALPTLASAETVQDRPQDGWHHHGDNADHGGDHRGEQPHGQPPRADQPRPAPQPAAAPPRPQPAPQAPAPQVQAQVQAQARFDGRGDRGRWGGDGNRFGGGAPFQAQAQVDQRARFGNGDPRRFDGGNRPTPAAPPPPAYRGPQGAPGGYRADAYGRGPAAQYRGAPGGNSWSRGWRDDRHYDWHSYRVENRYVFNLPRYYAPRGWNYGYRRFSPGITLFAGLFDEGFWINDPFYYRLPPAYGPYRWVRYYNDALLVDIRTGYVVDTVYDIFW